MKKNKQRKEILCRCNDVSRDEIEAAIKAGADTPNKIFDATTAGVGPCGGSCRKIIIPMLESFLKTGKFPDPPKKTKQD